MHHLGPRILLAAALIALVAPTAASTTHSAPASVALACPEQVALHQGIDVQRATTQYNAIAALSATDVWAAGAMDPTGALTVTGDFDPSETVPLLAHYDGHAWCMVDPRLPYNGAITSLSAVGAHDVWAAVETYGARQPDGLLPRETPLEHWDGRAWRPVAYAGALDAISTPSQVQASSSTNVWVLDQSGAIAHWDGRGWQDAPVSDDFVGSMAFGGVAGVRAVATLALTDTWAVGSDLAMPVSAGGGDAAIHWDGKEWRAVHLPWVSVPPRYDQTLARNCAPRYGFDLVLHEIAALSQNDVWAAGSVQTPDRCPAIYHWDGKSWRQTWVATGPQGAALLRWDLQSGGPVGTGYTRGWDVVGLAALSSRDVWAAVEQDGDYDGDGRGLATLSGLALRWDGTSWRVAAGMVCLPGALSAVSDKDMWVVDSHAYGSWPNACHWDGSMWHAAPIVLAG